MLEGPWRPDSRGTKAAPTFYPAPSICLRAIGPMYGISQRTPVNALMVATIQITRNAMCTTIAIKPQSNDRNGPIAGTLPKIRWTIIEAILNKNQAPPKIIDCMA